MLLIGGFFIWLLTVLPERLDPLEPSITAFAQALPVGYWVGLALVLASILVRVLEPTHKPSTAWDLSVIAALGSILFATPIILEETPRFFDVYIHYTQLLGLEQSGAVELGAADTASYIKNHPGAFILFASLQEILRIDPFVFASWYPLGLMLGLGIVVYATGRVLGLGRGAVLATLFFYGGAWYQEFHLSPQSIGLLLYGVILLLMARLVETGGFQGYRWPRVILVIVIGSTVISHAGTPIAIGFALATVGLAFYVATRLLRQHRLTWQPLSSFIVGATFFFSWQIYVSVGSFSSVLAQVRQAVRSAAESETPIVGKAWVVWDESYASLNHLREFSFVSLALLAFLAFVTAWATTKAEQRRRALLLFAMLLSASVLISIPLFSGGLYIERAGLFGLFATSLAVATLYGGEKRRRLSFLSKGLAAVALVWLLAFVALIPVTRNANDAFEWPSPPELAGASFAVQYGGPETTVAMIGNNGGPLGFFRTQKHIGRPLTVLYPPFNRRPPMLIETAPSGLGYVSLQFSAGEQYRSLLRSLNQTTELVYDAGYGVGVYYQERSDNSEEHHSDSE